MNNNMVFKYAPPQDGIMTMYAVTPWHDQTTPVYACPQPTVYTTCPLNLKSLEDKLDKIIELLSKKKGKK